MGTRTEVREITCILCPMGCKLQVKTRDGEVVEVEGAGCKRGTCYAVEEIRSPKRDFFTTVRVKGGKIPVASARSTQPVPKGLLMACAVELSKIILQAPVRIGDTIVKNVLGSGIDIVATKDVDAA